MPIDFPNSPSASQTFTDGTTTWIFNGTAWDILPNASPTFTSITANNITSNTNLTVNGTVSGINLSDLDNVSATSPANGAVLYYSTASSSWSSILLDSTFTGGTVPNPVSITSSQTSDSNSTGALTVTGGIGIGGSAFIGGNLTVETGFLDLRSRSELRFSDTDSSNYVGFKSPSNIINNKIWILPAADGTNGQFLRTDGSGNLSWASAGSGGDGSAVPGGSDRQIQYNDENLFNGDASFTFNDVTKQVTAENLQVTTQILLTDTTESTDGGTGSFINYGGVGIAGQLNVNGATNKFTGTTESTSTTTGTVVVSGGAGVAGNMFVGGIVDVPTVPTLNSHVTNKSYVDLNILAFSIAFGA